MKSSDWKCLSDAKLKKLIDDVRVELRTREVHNCKHEFQLAWNYHNGCEDNYSTCTKCGVIGTADLKLIRKPPYNWSYRD